MDDHVDELGRENTMDDDETRVYEAAVSPCGEYLTSSVLSFTILAVLELQHSIHNNYSALLSVIKHLFLPVNPRFSSIIVEDVNGVKKWKKVKVEFDDHVVIPDFPQGEGQSLHFYDEHLNKYLSRIAADPLPWSRPLWQLHLITYPTTNSRATLVFKLDHALGDGYSLMGVLLSCMQRLDHPSLPLTFPSRHPTTSYYTPTTTTTTTSTSSWWNNNNILTQSITGFFNTVMDFGWSFLKSNLIKDDVSPIRSGYAAGAQIRPVTITTITFSLHHIKQIKSKLHVTVNDVISGAILFGVRKYMEGENYESRNANSTVLILLNTRSIGGGYQSVEEMLKPNSKMPWGNRFAFLQIPIPKLLVSNDDPTNFVLQFHKKVKKKRNSAAVHLTASLLETLRKLRGPETSAKYIHSTIKNSSMGISNLIGPLEQMAIANNPVGGMYFSVMGPPQSVVVTVVSYAEKVSVCISMEDGFIDPHKLKLSIHTAFHMLFNKATAAAAAAAAT